MRLPLVLILPLLVLGVLVDWYIVRAVGARCRRRWPRLLAVWQGTAFALGLVVLIVLPKRSGSDADLTAIMWCLYAYFSVYMPKYIFVAVDLLAKLPQLFRRKRIKTMSVAGEVLAAVVFVAMWWGALVNRYSIDIREVSFESEALPEAFDGLRAVQISDIHTGSYGTDTAYLAKVVEAVNALTPDVILFTGDIVNRHSSELEPFTGVLGRLRARYGVYSVLGNHDYGDYYVWRSPEAKVADRRHLVELQEGMGWKMLNNATAVIHRGADSIAIVGVENIGDPPFPVYGDLDAAYPGDLADPVFKILMSHNPAHWTADIADAPDKNIPLTLSGHTHAMQMEVLGVSPAALRYSTWGGMYSDADGSHSLYVNIGIGEVGIPARIGATPEITLFTLSRK